MVMLDTPASKLCLADGEDFQGVRAGTDDVDFPPSARTAFDVRAKNSGASLMVPSMSRPSLMGIFNPVYVCEHESSCHHASDSIPWNKLLMQWGLDEQYKTDDTGIDHYCCIIDEFCKCDSHASFP